MHTLDFNRPLIGLDGTEPEKKVLLSKTFADILGTLSEAKRTLKVYGWYKSLLVGDPLIVDEADLQDLKKIVEEHKTLYVYVAGQLLDVINNSKPNG